jgi:hypothetical protein
MTEKTQTTKDIMQLFNRFAMCGLNKIVQDGDYSTTFHFKGGMQSKITLVKFSLNGKDLYDLEFGKIYRHDYRKVCEVNDLYIDQIRQVFESKTGYITTIPKVFLG